MIYQRIRRYTEDLNELLEDRMTCQKSGQHTKSFKDMLDQWLMSQSIDQDHFGLLLS